MQTSLVLLAVIQFTGLACDCKPALLRPVETRLNAMHRARQQAIIKRLRLSPSGTDCLVVMPRMKEGQKL